MKKRKKKPSLADRIKEVEDEADAALDRLAEELRPKGEGAAVPAASLRQMWLAKTAGSVQKAYLMVMEKGS